MKNNEFINRIRFRLGKLVRGLGHRLMKSRPRQGDDDGQLRGVHRVFRFANGVAVQLEQLRGARGIDVAERDAAAGHLHGVGAGKLVEVA